ncbi:MAG: MarR family transcriptional regulator [Gammaproteobacteria bacterium]|nr:MarR family transcriptional regulator [Gammaproteobacteria bacterium]
MNRLKSRGKAANRARDKQHIKRRIKELPLAASLGAAIRFTHRAFAVDLQSHLAAHDIPVGMWYFLRALWEEDGLTQRELSRRVGIMEPTTLQQLRSMEAKGLIERRRSIIDRRKIHVHLTRAGKALKPRLLPYALEVNAAAVTGFSPSELGLLRRLLARVQQNLARRQPE